MDQSEFVEQLENLFEVDAGAISTSLAIHDIPNWDSLTFVGLIAMVDEEYGVTLSPKDVLACQDVAELINVLDRQITSARKAA